MFQSGTVLQDRYRILNPLGQGGFSQTYEVDDQGTLKVLKVLVETYPKAVDLFQREAKVLSQLDHPGIPKVDPDGYFMVQAQGLMDPYHCLIMEHIPGVDLRQWLSDRQNQPVETAQAIDWLLQLIEILDQIHRRQCFHRDIKPSNIMLRPNGQVALIDFGAVREVTETYLQKCEEDITRTHVYSRGYTPIEQMQGRAVPESDFFALGRTFVHLMTGCNPLEFPIDPKTGQLMWRRQAPHIAPPLAELIDGLMAPFPGQRPSHAAPIRQALEELRDHPDWVEVGEGTALSRCLQASASPFGSRDAALNPGPGPTEMSEGGSDLLDLTQPPLDRTAGQSDWTADQGQPTVRSRGDRPVSVPTTLALGHPRLKRLAGLPLIVTLGLLMTGGVLGLRLSGLLQGLELRSLDHLLLLRPAEPPDSRLLLVTVDESDLEFQNQAGMARQGSLSDEALKQLLDRLTPLEPAIIGLDIYRDSPSTPDASASNGASPDRPESDSPLAYLEAYKNLIGVCSIGGGDTDYPGIRPPSTLPIDRIGFSDIPSDPDGRIRRQIIGMSPAEHCNTDKSLSYQLISGYLARMGIEVTFPDRTLYWGDRPVPQLQNHTGGYHWDALGGYEIVLNYRQTQQVADQVSLAEVLNGTLNEDLENLVRDRIVLIGTTARSFGDYHSTPSGEMAGVFIHAHMISQVLSAVLDGRPLIWAWPQWGDAIWILFWSAAAGGLVVYGRSRWLGMVGGGILVAGLLGLCYVGLLMGGWLPLVPTLLAMGCTAASVRYGRFLLLQPDTPLLLDKTGR